MIDGGLGVILVFKILDVVVVDIGIVFISFIEVVKLIVFFIG